jgi:hypothetical protein
MLKSKSVAQLIETTLNRNDKDEKFRVVYEVGSYKGNDINCILKQGKGTITPILNYTNVKTPFTINIIMPLHSGKERVDVVVDIVNDLIQELNGQVKGIDGGRAVFLFNPLEVGEYESRATVGQSVLIKLDFFVEYSNNSGTKYEMALISVPFDENSKNTKYFLDQDSQINWFTQRVESSGWWSEILTPNIKSLVIAQQRYTNVNMFDVSELVMKNYAIIRETKSNETINYYYYYITNSSIDQYNLILLDLKLDTLQTIYFNPNIKIPDCLINRAHLGRLRASNEANASYYMNFLERSPLFERDNVRDVSKRVVKREKLHFDITDSKGVASSINNWFAENVSHWLYYYLAGEPQYAVVKNALTRTTENSYLNTLKYVTGELEEYSEDNDNNVTDSSVVVLCCPVYKKDKKIKLPYRKSQTGDVSTRVIDYMTWDAVAIRQFLKDSYNITDKTKTENSYAYVHSIKNSIMPPFAKVDDARLSIDSDGDLIYTPSINDEPINASDGAFFETFGNLKTYANSSSNVYACCMTLVTYQDINQTNRMYINNPMYNPLLSYTDVMYNKTTTSGLFPYGIEPKLLNEDYSTYRLLFGGNTYDMPVAKTSHKPLFIYKEILSPDITKAMLIYDPVYSKEPSDVFTELNTKDFTGFTISLDLSIWFSTSALDSYLANNKNNLQIMQNNQNNRFNNMGVGSLQNVISNPVNAFGSLVGIGSNVLQYEMNKSTENTNYALTLDNMAQSPGSLSSLNSNALLMQSIDDLGIYIELQQPLSIEQEKIVNNFKMFGYVLGKIGNIKEYDNIRHDYNYIEANIEDIEGVELSNSIREDLRQRFSNGVRFWVGDKIDYNLPNYENWIEEGV